MTRPAPAKLSWLTNDQYRELTRLRRLRAEDERNLRWYHDVGRCLKALRPRKDSYGTNWLRSIANEVPFAATNCGLVMRFACEYDENEVAKLEKAGFGWTNVSSLLKVQDRGLRDELQSEALEKDWSNDRLLAAIHERQGYTRRRRSDYRPEPGGVGVEARLRELTTLAEKWLRIQQVDKDLVKELHRLSHERLGTKLQHAIDEAIALFGQLREGAAQQASELSKLQKQLGEPRNRRKPTKRQE